MPVHVLLVLHALAAVVWVGGMFFAYVVLRPAAGALEPPVRLPLWQRTFETFFAWVWGAMAVLLLTGYAMIPQMGGFAAVGPHVHLMQGIGIGMMLLFLHLWFAPYRRFRLALAGNDLSEAGRRLDQIRLLVKTNLTLGLLVVAIGASGRYWT